TGGRHRHTDGKKLAAGADGPVVKPPQARTGGKNARPDEAIVRARMGQVWESVVCCDQGRRTRLLSTSSFT
ncbi:MAG TPA: hypothetical protein PKL15_13410, partial [Saprospiraceae bacterium]|nr:hypothetical protein [Saprospiraceae bacterium]